MRLRIGDIAIVGMACRFPGLAHSLAEFWEILRAGRDVVGEVGSDRWNTDYYYHGNPKEPGKSYTFSAGLVDGLDAFDAQFFGISPREAAQMDPQQRLLLELAWEALEDAGQGIHDTQQATTPPVEGRHRLTSEAGLPEKHAPYAAVLAS